MTETRKRRQGVIVDRDGTLVDVVRDGETGVVSVAFHPSHLRFLPGVIEGLRTFADAKWPIAIATNQPGAAKGQLPRSAIEATNAALLDRLAEEGVPVAALEVCFHHPEGGAGGDATLVGVCSCRKPAPGMLLAIVERLGLDLSQSWMIGDSTADLEAARAASMNAGLLFDPRRCEICPLRPGPASLAPDLSAPRLDELAALVVEKCRAPG